MLVEKNSKEALEYYIKGKPVTALWIGEDGGMNAMPLSDILDQPEKKLEKETVVAPGKMSREEKSKIIRPLIKKGLKNKEIAECTGIPLGTVNGLSGPIRKELKNPVKAEMIKSGDNSDRHKCRTCQYRHGDAGGCDYCIHTGRERGCEVEICDKAVVGERLTKK